jgi:general stress protein YciG
MEPEAPRDMPSTTDQKRGFAMFTPERRTEIACQGGKMAHARGRAHEFSRDEARTAGRKGGRAVSGNRQHMAMIGRQGGRTSQVRRREQADRAVG